MNGYALNGVGVASLEGLDGALVPRAFVAVTVKVYGVPLTRPVTVADAVVDVTDTAPGEDKTT